MVSSEDTLNSERMIRLIAWKQPTFHGSSTGFTAKHQSGTSSGNAKCWLFSQATKFKITKECTDGFRGPKSKDFVFNSPFTLQANMRLPCLKR